MRIIRCSTTTRSRSSTEEDIDRLAPSNTNITGGSELARWRLEGSSDEVGRHAFLFQEAFGMLAAVGCRYTRPSAGEGGGNLEVHGVAGRHDEALLHVVDRMLGGGEVFQSHHLREG